MGSVKNKLQLTLAIIKPSVMQMPLALNDIHEMIINAGFFVICTKRLQMSVEDAKKFYKEHENKFFYNRLVTYMCSGPLMAHILAKDNSIQSWRELMGPTKVYKTKYSHPDSIRGIFGLSDTRNAVHGSDSEDSASKEINFFFPTFNISKWYEKEERKFANGEVVFDEDNFIHKIKS